MGVKTLIRSCNHLLTVLNSWFNCSKCYQRKEYNSFSCDFVEYYGFTHIIYDFLIFYIVHGVWCPLKVITIILIE